MNVEPKLEINKLGPIDYCRLNIKQYTFLTGYQASGKSTIAKAIYFFRTLKEEISKIIIRQCYGNYHNENLNLKREFESVVRNKFLNTFGTSYSMDSKMCMTYIYGDYEGYQVKVSIYLKERQDYASPNYVYVQYSDKIKEFLKKYEKEILSKFTRGQHNSINSGQENFQELLKYELEQLFNDDYETVYIPAGRSILTVLGGPFNYMYTIMDDDQKRLLDSCTRDYLERVLKLRPQFGNGLEGLGEGKTFTYKQQDNYKEAINLTRNILKGKYIFSDGEERILLDSGRYVKINFASSGQQESVWILNLLYYYLVLQKKIYFIIEEPESNLFPESQKNIVELIALVANAGNAVLLTTHSPYVLGSINNLIYAGSIGKKSPDTEKIVAKNKWIDSQRCSAFFVNEHGLQDAMDSEIVQIDNNLLDQISHVINREYDELFAIEQKSGEE